MGGAMRTPLYVATLALLAGGCGSSPSPATPALGVVPLAAGPYRLSLAGTNCIMVASGAAPPAVSTSFDVPIVVSAAGPVWEFAANPDSLTGTFSSDGSILIGRIGGTLVTGTTRFASGTSPGDMLSIGGFAPGNDRFEGMVTEGRPIFSASSDSGQMTATCQSGTFVLRRAS
jgi:hypothetical protein